MHAAASPRGLLVAALLLAAAARHAPAQDAAPRLQLGGLTPVGFRSSVSEAWGALEFTVTNPTPEGREARVAVYYAGHEDVQFAREVWVPGRASVTSWVTLGPAPGAKSDLAREIRAVLTDRTGGRDEVVLPSGEERVRTRMVLYKKREVTTAILGGGAPVPLGESGGGPPDDVLALVRLVRREAGLSEFVSLISSGRLPVAAEAFDGIDVLVLAGDQLASDPPARAAVRRWVQGGGRLWVMLDRVDPAGVAPLLGEGFDVGVVDRVGLTSVRLGAAGQAKLDSPREFEQPVPFVRVAHPATDRLLASANGWPAAFVRRIGRGTVLFTTLGGPAWSQSRGPRDPRSPGPNARDIPLATPAVRGLVNELHPPPEPDPLPPDAFRPMLAEEIGYAVVGRGAAALILGGFVAAVAVLGLRVRRSRRPGLAGWLVPAASLVAAALFVGLGERSRRSVPPTLGVAGVVDPVAGSGEATVSGLYAIYNPASGPVELGTSGGATFGLDEEGLAGQLRKRVQSDTDAWRWEGLSLPAGVRTGTFRNTTKIGRVAATARFGPDGLEGRLEAGSFPNVGDAVLVPASREALAVHLGPDGSFRVGPADLLPADQFLTGAVLSDRQQRRQTLYRQLLTPQPNRAAPSRDLLLAWADPAALPVVPADGARVVGSLLLAVPLEFERTPPNTAVTIPRGLIPCRRVFDAGPAAVTTSGSIPTDMRLRFQIPPSVVPLQVERATLFAKFRAPFRRVTISGLAGDSPVQLFRAEAPGEPVRIDVTDERLLRLDAQGGLNLNLAIGGLSPGAPIDSTWAIEVLSLEVVGRTGEVR